MLEMQEQIFDPNGWLFNEEMTFVKKTFERERELTGKKKWQLVREKSF